MLIYCFRVNHLDFTRDYWKISYYVIFRFLDEFVRFLELTLHICSFLPCSWAVVERIHLERTLLLQFMVGVYSNNNFEIFVFILDFTQCAKHGFGLLNIGTFR